jgi:dUTP pyrophosphatase
MPPRPTAPSVPPAAVLAALPARAPIESVVVSITRIGTDRGIPLPAYQSELAAGMDLHASIDGPLSIAPNARVLVPTGIAIALPPGFEAQVRPRSGLAWSRGITILNAPGTIDADYRGEIKVLLVNLGQAEVNIAPGERIAQLVVARHARAELMIVDALDETKRGSGGYGSTGI